MRVAHLADAHVRSLSRHDETRIVVTDFLEQCKRNSVDHIFFAGDAFHTKCSGMSPECIELLCWMLDSMAKVAETHLILGNHDFLIANKTRQDAITPIVEAISSPRLHLYKNSGVYEFTPGFNWCVYSLFDKENWDSVKPAPGMVNIACYHGPLMGAVSDTGWKVVDGLTEEFFKPYTFTFLGDIHTHQFMGHVEGQKPRMGYPGSALQQSYGELEHHGFILWDIEDRDNFDVKFCRLPNPRPYVTLDWMGTVGETLEQAKRCKQGTRFRIRCKCALSQKDVTVLSTQLHSDMQASEVTFKTEQQVSRDVITSVDGTILAKEDLRNVDVLVQLLRGYHTKNNITDDEWDVVREYVGVYLRGALENDVQARNTKWTLKQLKFDNTFTYGEGNVIDFEKLDGIVGIFGANRIGKSSIVGALMYSLFNATDRGSLKNLFVINNRHQHCYTRAVVNVNAVDYIIERQTVKGESPKGLVFANTSLNAWRLEADGTEVDLVGEDRKDTEKAVRKLIGTADDCMLTSISTQDDVKLFIAQGSTKRRKDLSRFLDLDIFDRMNDLAKVNVNAAKTVLKNIPSRDWSVEEETFSKRLSDSEKRIVEVEVELQEANDQLRVAQDQLTSFKGFTPVTQTQVEQQRRAATQVKTQLDDARNQLVDSVAVSAKTSEKIVTIEALCKEHDLTSMRKSLESQRVLESTLETLRHAHDKDISLLKQQEKTLKTLDLVPCGDAFPTCRFIKDAFAVKGKVEAQHTRVKLALDKVSEAEQALATIKDTQLQDRIAKVERLVEQLSKLRSSVSRGEIDRVKLEATISDLEKRLVTANDRLSELEAALRDDENVEVVSARNSVDKLQRQVKVLDNERIKLAGDVGRTQAELTRLFDERDQRQELLQKMKAHELISNAFSRKGIPNAIIVSQLPSINAEIAKILNGIVDFTVQLEQDPDNDSMEVYIDYGDSRRIIELGSGMEKVIASIAIRVALINVSSLPKTDMFIMDESFGALDPASVEACNRLLVSLKKHFRLVIVISHVEGVKDSADHIIEITKREKDAYVCVE